MTGAASQPGLFEAIRTPDGVSYGQPAAAAEGETPARRFSAWLGANPMVLEVFIEYTAQPELDPLSERREARP